MNLKDSLKIIGGLSQPSKMPGYSWSTPASSCRVGSKLVNVKGSTCNNCYALKGCYVFKVVQDALNRRLAALENPLFVEAFSYVLLTKYNNMRKEEHRFRWHDSGDLQSVEHLRKINQIALNTPNISHWLPTRELGILKEFLKSDKVADNLTIRVSAAKVGSKFKSQPLGLPYSTVGVNNDKELFQCVAPKQGGKCLDCDTCWKKERNVNYPQH